MLWKRLIATTRFVEGVGTETVCPSNSPFRVSFVSDIHTHALFRTCPWNMKLPTYCMGSVSVVNRGWWRENTSIFWHLQPTSQSETMGIVPYQAPVVSVCGCVLLLRLIMTAICNYNNYSTRAQRQRIRWQEWVYIVTKLAFSSEEHPIVTHTHIISVKHQ